MKRSKHSLSNYKLLSCDMGELVPIGLTEVLPGDSIQQTTSALIRLSPLLAPMMHPVHARIHHWFVPHRLVWDSWEDFITGGPDGEDDSAFPYITTPVSTGFAIGTLADYLGVTPGVPSLQVSALPFRGYALIYNEWYRDQDLNAELGVSLADGSDTTTNTTLRNVSWEKDYFTSARPWPQKGPDVTVPISGTATPFSDGTAIEFTQGTNVRNLRMTNANNTADWSNSNTATGTVRFGNNTGIGINLSNAQVDVTDLRNAMALQRFQEARAKYGSRYTEYLRYLGVRSSDARLQRPEYLGGGKNLLQISEVLQTSPTTDGDDTDGVGNLKGHGIGALRSNRYRRFFEEHGYVFTLLSVKPKTIYAQGLARHWQRRTKEDFFQKELQHIGQQEVTLAEVYAGGTNALTTVFGYQDRYDEYRRTESTIAGEFRDTLDFWHMARIFSTDPTLNGTFVQSNPTKRMLASESTDALYVMANHSIQARRLVAASGNSFIY